MDSKPYRTTEEKVSDVERYLVLQVDAIKRWVVAAFVLAALAASAAIYVAVTARADSSPEPLAEAAMAGTSAPETTTAEAPAPAAVAEVTPESPDRKTVADAPKGDVTATKSASQADPSSDVPADAELASAWRERVAASASSAPANGARDVDRPSDTAPRTPDEARPATSPGATASTADVVNDAPSRSNPVSAAPALIDDGWSFEVAASAIARSVDDLEPVDVATSFPNEPYRLFCWTRIETEDLVPIPVEDRYVVHRWIHGADVVKEQTITIGSPKYRVYSMVGGVKDRPGTWRVEVYDARGRKIDTLRFTVG